MTKIVVVDDDDLFRRAVAECLSLEGFEVDAYPHLLDLSVLARDQLPDLIVCDVMLPGCSGVDILKRIRATPGISEIPFIFLSARTEPSFQREAMNLGGDDYVTKPVSSADLVNAVRARLARFKSRHERGTSSPAAETRTLTSSKSDLMDGFERLSPREREVLSLLIQGLGNHQIGERLFISESTVKRHLLQVFLKLKVESRSMAISSILRSAALTEKLLGTPTLSPSHQIGRTRVDSGGAD